MTAPIINLEIGNSGLRRSGGRVRDEFLNQLKGNRGVRNFREMSDNNAVVGASLSATGAVVKRASWKWEAASQDPGPRELEARDFIESAWLDTSHSWTQFLSEVLSMNVYGWSFFEIVYKRRDGVGSRWSDGRIGWKKWGLRVQESLDRWEFDPEGGIDGMWQRGTYGLGSGAPVFIPIKKAALFRAGPHRGDPEGRSPLRPAYRSWWFVKRLQELEAIAMERELAGLPVATVPPEFLLESATDDQKAMVRALKLLVQQIRADERAGLVIPASKVDGNETGYGFTLLTSGGSRAVDISAAIVRYEQRIALTMLTQFLLLGMNKVGSFALSKGHESVFGARVGSIMDEISDVTNRFIVPPLMRLNGFPPEVYPRLVHGEVDAPELGQLANYVSSLVAAGALHPDPATEARLREFASLEARQRSTVPATAPATPGAAPTDDAPDTGVAPEAATEEAAEAAVVSEVALNGAQVTAAQGIVQSVAEGRLPRSSGVAMLTGFFGLSAAQAETIMGEVGGTFTATPAAE